MPRRGVSVKRDVREVVAFVLLAFIALAGAHACLACYSDRDPNLPPCSAAPTACGDYPAVTRDAGSR